MFINDAEKRRVMEELAQGNPNQEPVFQPSVLKDENEQQDYENFDDFAQRSSEVTPVTSVQNQLKLVNQIKEQITTDLQQAKEVGQLRSSRIREIVQAAVFQVGSELKYGSTDVRTIIKDAVLAVSESLQEKGGEIKEEVTATIEGVIEGVSSWRRQSIAESQAEVKQLQNKIDSQENELQKEIERLLVDAEEAGKDSSPKLKASIEDAIAALKNSEEVALMKKRYAQLQAQLAILQANLAARYGGRYEEVKQYLDEAKTWYNKTHTKTETAVEQAEQKLEAKIREAGESLTKDGGRRLRKLLSDLLKTANELIRDKETPTK